MYWPRERDSLITPLIMITYPARFSVDSLSVVGRLDMEDNAAIGTEIGRLFSTRPEGKRVTWKNKYKTTPSFCGWLSLSRPLSPYFLLRWTLTAKKVQLQSELVTYRPKSISNQPPTRINLAVSLSLALTFSFSHDWTISSFSPPFPSFSDTGMNNCANVFMITR